MQKRERQTECFMEYYKIKNDSVLQKSSFFQRWSMAGSLCEKKTSVKGVSLLNSAVGLG